DSPVDCVSRSTPSRRLVSSDSEFRGSENFPILRNERSGKGFDFALIAFSTHETHERSRANHLFADFRAKGSQNGFQGSARREKKVDFGAGLTVEANPLARDERVRNVADVRGVRHPIPRIVRDSGKGSGAGKNEAQNQEKMEEL